MSGTDRFTGVGAGFGRGTCSAGFGAVPLGFVGATVLLVL